MLAFFWELWTVFISHNVLNCSIMARLPALMSTQYTFFTQSPKHHLVKKTPIFSDHLKICSDEPFSALHAHNLCLLLTICYLPLSKLGSVCLGAGWFFQPTRLLSKRFLSVLKPACFSSNQKVKTLKDPFNNHECHSGKAVYKKSKLITQCLGNHH